MSKSPEQRAIEQHLSKPAPQYSACGCLGPQLLPGETTTGPDGYTDLNKYANAKRYPFCPCMMQTVEEVDGVFYSVERIEQPGVPVQYVAHWIGVVGGPYK